MMDKKNTINILSIDPGANCGVTIFTINIHTLEIVGIESILLLLNNYVNKDDTKDNMNFRLKVLHKRIVGIVKEYDIRLLAIENAFLNSRFPKAVMQLSQYISTIELACNEVNKFIRIYKYQPTVIKKRIGAGGGANKDGMTSAINSIKDITKFVNPLNMTEHQVDSIAIGYLAITDIRDNPAILILL